VRLDKVMDEVAQVLEEITGLRVLPYPPDDLTPPAGYLSYPERIEYDTAYQRGEDTFHGLPVVLLASHVTGRHARDQVGRWTAGDGPHSIKALFEAHTWTDCHEVVIQESRFDVEKLAGGEYLAALFTATITGPGKED
jgi:hypothetical protein